MSDHRGLARRWWSVGLLLAAALTLRADVLVLKNGSLLLGRPVAVDVDSITLALGTAGSIKVKQADIQRMISCLPAEEPDTYLKAAQRAAHTGLLAEAFACCEKSIAVEPATVTIAQSLRVTLQRLVLAGAQATARTIGSSGSAADQQRLEAQRMIAEGEQMLRAAQLAANLDTLHRGSSAQAIQRQGKADIVAAQAKIEQGKAMLEKAEKVMASASTPLSTPETVAQWGWLIGGGVVVLAVLWFLLSPFLSRR